MTTTTKINGKEIEIHFEGCGESWMDIAAHYNGEVFECGAWIVDEESASNYKSNGYNKPVGAIYNSDDDEIPFRDAAGRFCDAVFGPRDEDGDWQDADGTWFSNVYEVRPLIVDAVDKVIEA